MTNISPAGGHARVLSWTIPVILRYLCSINRVLAPSDMKRAAYYFGIGMTACLFLAAFSCKSQRAPIPQKRDSTFFSYDRFRDSVLRIDTAPAGKTPTVFDRPGFNPGRDSLRPLLEKMDTFWRREAKLAAQLDTLHGLLGKEAGFSPGELQAIRDNIAEVERFLAKGDSTPVSGCQGKNCLVYAEVNKTDQRLYLYILGELKDTFKVSTGKGKKYETPSMSRHPRGPVLVKYTSRKFPGGDYLGLGNMPYAVFVSGGYAIHGTTPGNFSKLGRTASHGCIRLHPDNAKVFNALVRSVGLSQTWVVVKD